MSTWENSYPLPQGKRVVIDQGSGRVTVRGWEQSTVSVKASTRFEANIDELLKVEERSDGLYLATRSVPSGFLFWQSRPEVELELSVPYHTALKLDSGSGSVLIHDTRAKADLDIGSGGVEIIGVGSVNINAGSGSVTLRNVDGSVQLDGGSGNVEVNQVNGPVRIEVGSGGVVITKLVGDLHVDTGSGQVAVTEALGRIMIDTGSGGISLTKVQGDEVHIDTGSGSVAMEAVDTKRLIAQTKAGSIHCELLAVHPGGSYHMETRTGIVTTKVPPKAGFEAKLESPQGLIRYEGVPLKLTHHERGEVHGTVGGGGAAFYIYGEHGVTLVPAPSQPASPVDTLVQTIKQDAALESNEAMRRVLKMVEEGKLSAEEADEILRALEEEEAVQA